MRYQISNFQLLVQMLHGEMPPNDGCLLWPRGTFPNGYGEVRHNGLNRGVHVVAFEMGGGQKPKGWMVCHSCDNKPCFRFSHLFAGTALDNIRDCISKGRRRYDPCAGERSGNAKMTDVAVLEMRKLYAAGGWTQKELAAKFGISKTNAGAILIGTAWLQLPGADPASHRYHGSQVPNAKLTEAQVLQIRRLRAEGWKYQQLADRFSVSQGLIGHIMTGLSWTHVTPRTQSPAPAELPPPEST